MRGERRYYEVCFKSAVKKLCDKGLLHKFDTGVYFIPKKTLLNSTIVGIIT